MTLVSKNKQSHTIFFGLKIHFSLYKIGFITQEKAPVSIYVLTAYTNNQVIYRHHTIGLDILDYILVFAIFIIFSLF